MFFHFKDLELKPVSFDLAFQPEEMELAGRKWRSSEPGTIEGVAEAGSRTLEEIEVRGRLRAGYASECDRCLEPAVVRLDQEFHLLYRPEEMAPGSEEVELEEEEAELGFYGDEGVDLFGIVREIILLNLPMHALCRKDCLGLCPVCGTNRNQIACGCEVERPDDRWAALKGLRVEGT
jgi:uncharacterized protein